MQAAVRQHPSLTDDCHSLQDRRGALACDWAASRRDWPALEHAARAWISRRPQQASAWRQAARALFEQGRHHQASLAFEHVVEHEGRTADTLAALGSLRLHGLDYDAARAAIDEALTLDPAHARALATRATLLTYLGRFAEAEACARKSLDGEPGNAAVFTLLTRLTQGRLEPDETERLQRLADDPASPIETRTPAAFALAHALDASGETDLAFAAYERAHALDGDRVWDHEAAVARARRIVALPDEPRLKPGARPTPIFIVGTARSGTTLVEAILSSHPRVFGAGERVVMPSLLEAWLAQEPQGVAPDGRWAAAYLEGLTALGGRDHVTDKMPRNLEAVGLINRLFPDAPIVLMRRNPVETCLSIYRQEFSQDWAFVHDQTALARACALDARLAAHWTRTRPGRIIEVQYETLAGNLDVEARRLVEACGLVWDPACAQPGRVDRPIATFSTVTARQPVRVMNDRADAYRPHLTRLIDELQAQGVDLETGALRPDVDPGLA